MFESKTQSKAFDLWCYKVLAVPGVSKRLSEARVRMIVTCVQLSSLTRQHYDLKVLFSQWSFEAHTLIVA